MGLGVKGAARSIEKRTAAFRVEIGETLNPAFMRLLGALTVANLGKSITLVGLPILVIERYGLGAEVANAMSLRLLPMIFGGVLAAWSLSRFDPRWVAAIAMCSTGVMTFFIPFSENITQLNLLSIASGVTSIFASPALMALRSGVIKESAAMRGNGFIVAAERTPQVAGPAIAAGLLLVADVSVLFVAEAITTTAGAALLIGIPLAASERVRQSRPQNSLARWKRSILHDPRMHGYIVTGLTYTVALSAGRLLFIAIATSSFSYNPSALPLMLSAMAAGAVLGGLFASQFPLRLVGALYVLGNVLEALGIIGVGLSSSFLLTLFLLFFCGVCESVATAGFFADVQLRLPKDMTGQFFSLFISGINVCAVVGTLMGGWLMSEANVLVGALVIAGFIALPLSPYIGVYLGKRHEVLERAEVSD